MDNQLDFDTCPNCLSTRRVANEVMEELKASGQAREEMKAFLFNHTTIVADQSKRSLTVPVVQSYYDACADCGTVYVVHVEYGKAAPQIPKPPESGLFRAN